MSNTSQILSLPLIQPAQAQKHVTHNEALWILDAVVQLVVNATDQTAPPQAVQSGDRYIVAAQGTGAWAGHDGKIAVYADTAWSFITPLPGWRAEVLTPESTVIFDTAAGWHTPATTVETTVQLGINTAADAVNRLSVSSSATLLSHEGAGHQLKLNKAAADDTASLLYQTGFSGRAEMGLAGNDDFALKVSDDGTTWREALKVDAATARVIAPTGIESMQVSVPSGTTLTIQTPSPAGFALISSVSQDYPQGTASMILCYDVGLSPQLFLIWSGGAVTNLGNTPPTGTSGPAGKVNVGVQNNGTLYLENRYPNNTDLEYCVTWINSWR